MALAVYRHPGETIDYTPVADTPANTVVLVGTKIGVVVNDIVADETGSISIDKVYAIPKTATTTTFAQGSEAYWDGTGMTDDSTGNTLAMYVTKASGTADTTVEGLINGQA